MSRRWEALCRRCGACCHEKRYVSGRMIVDYGSPCRHLDQDSRQCRVYEVRFRACRECRRMTVFHALFSPYLPAGCGYVRAFRKWRRAPAPPGPSV